MDEQISSKRRIHRASCLLPSGKQAAPIFILGNGWPGCFAGWHRCLTASCGMDFQVTCPLVSAATAALEKDMELLTTGKESKSHLKDGVRLPCDRNPSIKQLNKWFLYALVALLSSRQINQNNI